MAFDTKTVTLHEDAIEALGGNEFNWSQEQTIAIVKLAFDNTEIGPQQNFRSFGATEIVKGAQYSRAAYVETDSGYFIISIDMMQHINVTYARWD